MIATQVREATLTKGRGIQSNRCLPLTKPSFELLLGDCLTAMREFADGSIDLILCDLPYGVTECAWDKLIPSAPLWAEYSRLLKSNGAVLLFAQQPFASRIAAAAPHELRLRYEWIWDKEATTGFQNANRMPLRRHENILVFYRHLPHYQPQGLKRCKGVRVRSRRAPSEVYGRIRREAKQRFTGYPSSIVSVKREAGALPCQKPVALLEYMIRTYTRRGATVLDNCMGTGSTGVAAVQSRRRFIGMELDVDRFGIAARRVTEAARG